MKQKLSAQDVTERYLQLILSKAPPDNQFMGLLYGLAWESGVTRNRVFEALRGKCLRESRAAVARGRQEPAAHLGKGAG